MRKPLTDTDERHGTPAGYQAHHRDGIPVCEPCRKALCEYERDRKWRKAGPEQRERMRVASLSTHERFMERFVVDEATGCWVWTHGLSAQGYAHFQVDGNTLGHRYSYTHFVGPIPAGLHLDHLCRNKPCVNPDHLEPVTMLENIARSPLASQNKTHCIRGHAFDEKNTRIDPDGKRACRKCGVIQTDLYRKRKRIRDKDKPKKKGGVAPYPREHGTLRGHTQHKKRGESPCRPCKDALNAHDRARRAAARLFSGDGSSTDPTEVTCEGEVG